MSILEVRSVDAGYGAVQILRQASLALEEGQLTALVGSNGAGKTTLLRTVMGLIRPWQGSVWFEGREISHLPAYTRAGMGLALAPEGRQLFTDMSVAENLEMGATPRRARKDRARNLERVYHIFPRLSERREQKAGTLSGGEQQMLAVARGLMAEPLILMIDELSLGLSPAMSMQLLEALLALKKNGMTTLLVEQNVQMALAISDYGYVLSQGRTDLEGPSRDLAQNEKVRVAYLGMGSRPA